MGFGLAGLAMNAAAQEPPPTESLDDIAVSAQRIDPRRYAEASQVTVSNDELVKFGDANLLDAIKRVPGVTVNGTDVRLRGLGSGYTQILINGDPAPLGFALDSLSPDAVERIEIYRTPVASLSTQSIAGSINIVLKEKAKEQHLSTKLAIAYNQGNMSPAWTADASETQNPLSLQITGTASKQHISQSSHIDELDYDATNAMVTRQVISEAYERDGITYNLTPVIGWKGKGDTISWQLLVQRFEYPFLYDLNEKTLIGPPSDYPYSRWQSRSPARDLYKSNLTWGHEFSQDQSLESKLNVSYQARHSNFYFDGYDPNGVFALDRNIVSSAIDRLLVSKEKYVLKLNQEQSLAFGWDGSITQRSESRLQIDRSPEAEGVLDILDQAYDARVTQKALYAQDEWAISPSWEVYLGTRLEITDVRLTGSDFGVASNNSAILSPIAQVIWKMPFNPKDQLRLNIAHTSRAPTTSDLVPRRYTVNTDNGPANPDNQGNPHLKPERAWGFDASYESYFKDDGLFALSGYLRRIDEVMTPILFTDGAEWVTSTANDGKAKAYGTEAELKLPVQRVFGWASKLEVKADVSANWSDVKNVPAPNNRLAEQTPVSADLAVEYEATRSFTAGATFRYAPGYTARATPYFSYYNGMSQSLDLYGTWQMNAASRIRFSFENALHRNEVSATLYADSGMAANRFTSGDPGDRVTLSFEIGI